MTIKGGGFRHKENNRASKLDKTMIREDNHFERVTRDGEALYNFISPLTGKIERFQITIRHLTVDKVQAMLTIEKTNGFQSDVTFPLEEGVNEVPGFEVSKEDIIRIRILEEADREHEIKLLETYIMLKLRGVK